MPRGAVRHNDIDSWMNDRPGGGKGRRSLLGNWKKKPGWIEIFLSLTQAPARVYLHSIPTRVPIEDRDSGEERVEVFTKDFCCHETVEVIEAQYDRNDDGTRERSPQRCGLCKTREYLWMECEKWLKASKPVKRDEAEEATDDKGKKRPRKRTSKVGIDPTTVIFKFVTEDARNSDDQEIMAGAFCGMFSQQKPPEELTEHLRACRIRPDDAWKGNGGVQCKYAISMVDVHDVAKGVQLAVEPQAIGQRTQDAINKVIKSKNVRYGQGPYAIRWEKNEKDDAGKPLYFGDKYSAIAPMEMIKLTPEISKMIRGPAPPLSIVDTPFNQGIMRAMLEKACTKPDLIPWDALWPTEEQEEKWRQEDAKSAEETAEQGGEESEDDEEEDDAPPSTPAPKEKKAEKPKADKHAPPEDEIFGCDECGKPVKATDSKCPHCGYKFDVEEAPADTPPPRKRSEAKKTSSKKSPDREVPDPDPNNGEETDGVPF